MCKARLIMKKKTGNKFIECNMESLLYKVDVMAQRVHKCDPAIIPIRYSIASWHFLMSVLPSQNFPTCIFSLDLTSSP